MLIDFIRDEDGATIVEYAMVAAVLMFGVGFLACIAGIVFLCFKVGMAL